MVEKLAKKIKAGEATGADFEKTKELVSKSPCKRSCFFCEEEGKKGVLIQDDGEELSFTCIKCKRKVTGERAFVLYQSRVEEKRVFLRHVESKIQKEITDRLMI